MTARAKGSQRSRVHTFTLQALPGVPQFNQESLQKPHPSPSACLTHEAGRGAVRPCFGVLCRSGARLRTSVGAAAAQHCILSGPARDVYFFFRAAAGGHRVAIGGGNQSFRIRLQATHDSARITPSLLRREFGSSPRAGSRISARAELDYSGLVPFFFATDVIIQ
ncbi:hypothetical protein BJV77DRAFT_204667 [Russula vinacea]|nr:hypothetical protein BJV77DRAFT_204667 [Russula vinacea]